jgi:NAD(P)-dependent dehydrogenase (short-subunit alcohol dehydrogenase family)
MPHTSSRSSRRAAVAASRSWPTSPTRTMPIPRGGGGGRARRPRHPRQQRRKQMAVEHVKTSTTRSSRRRSTNVRTVLAHQSGAALPRRGDHQYGLAGGLRTGAGPPGLCRDKAAINNLQGLAQLAPRGIRVNVVAPGRRGRRCRSPTGSRTSR